MGHENVSSDLKHLNSLILRLPDLCNNELFITTNWLWWPKVEPYAAPRCTVSGSRARADPSLPRGSAQRCCQVETGAGDTAQGSRGRGLAAGRLCVLPDFHFPR